MANTDSVLNNQKVLIKVTLTKLCLDEKNVVKDSQPIKG